MTKSTTSPWHPASWKEKPMHQQINYTDSVAVESVVAELSSLPPLIAYQEVDKLKQHIADAQQGRSFIMQGGDCAESFADCNAESITKKLRLLLSFSLELSQRLEKPIIRVGRIAGQYAKPRSQNHETQGAVSLPSYRGDLVNHIHFSESSRLPDPQRLLQGYNYAAHTVNYIRSLLDGDINHLFDLQQEIDGVSRISPEKTSSYLLDVAKAVTLLQHLNGPLNSHKGLLEFYTSHEALHLHYEQALTRSISHARTGQTAHYNLSTHFPWLGMRTAIHDSAHVEYLRGIANPIAIKVGPEMSPADLVTLCRTLNPNNEAGRITLIHRFGATEIATNLPPLIQAVQAAELTVLWSCDPMHGNTEGTATGLKTRDLANIQSEIEQAFLLHEENRSFLGGLHLEMTPDPVIECINRATTHEDSAHKALNQHYKSLVDPRLNTSQLFELLSAIERAKAILNSKAG